VCMTCSGLHREFQHKCKGISMSKWTAEEVKTIEGGGGNLKAERCRISFLQILTYRHHAQVCGLRHILVAQALVLRLRTANAFVIPVFSLCRSKHKA